MNIRLFFLSSIILLTFASTNSYCNETKIKSCGNLVTTPYKSSPKFFAPDGSRGEGVSIWINGQLKPIPDTRAGCLPIPLRYNNIGAIKTPKRAPWTGQIGKDDKSHAIFGSVEQGITAWGLWMKNRQKTGVKNSAFSIMSLYAPPDDCVGSIGIFPDCPFGINPTEEYAARVAAAVKKQPNDPLNLDATDCKEGRDVLYALLQEIASFEIGGNFCGKENKKSKTFCSINREIFDKAMDTAYSPVKWGPCSDPAEAHEKE